jgi:hypothetical protein
MTPLQYIRLQKIFMKASLLFVAVFFVTTNLSAQIEIKETLPKFTVGTYKAGGVMHTELSYRITDKDTVYTLIYKNAKYSSLVDYKSISFNSDNNTLQTFYNLLKSFFSNEHKKDKDYKVSFKIGDTNVTASNFRTMGITGVTLFTPEGYITMNERMVDKTFGKD